MSKAIKRVWTLRKDNDKIERVQKVILKFLLRQNYASYTEVCKQFGISKLSQRREKLCLNFALKEFQKASSIFMKVPNSDKRPQRRVAKKNVVSVPKSRTQRHMRSCFVYLSNILNNHHNGWRMMGIYCSIETENKLLFSWCFEHWFYYPWTHPKKHTHSFYKYVKQVIFLFPFMIFSWSYVIWQKGVDHEDSTWWVVLFKLWYHVLSFTAFTRINLILFMLLPLLSG